jgi:amino acid adenylation domain-containing protein
VPSAFISLKALPLTANGKIDRRALPAPDTAAGRGRFVAPRSPREEILAGLWAEVLGVERVGAEDNFFELGGHSLLATQVISRVRKVFQTDLPLREFLESPTVAGLAASVERALRAGEGLAIPPIVPVRRGAPLPLSFAQQRLWFLQQLDPRSTAYNIPVNTRFRGPLDLGVLAACFRALAARHESLRTTFLTVEGEPWQVIAPGAPVNLPLVDLGDLAAETRERELRRLSREQAQTPFDLSRGPLLRLVAVAEGAAEHAVLATMHHIISDGWSLAVFVRELGVLYEAFSAGRPSPLADLEVQYADFACWQRGWLSGEVLEGELGYWRRRLSGSPVLELPTDRPRPAIQTPRGASLRFDLGGERLLAATHDLGRRQGVTLFMTLLAAFEVLLHRYSGQDDIAVGTSIANRNHLQTESLIGFFVNTLVLRTDLAQAPTFAGLLEQVRTVALEAYAHQDLPFEKLVEDLQPRRDLSRSPLFQVMFSLLNAPRDPLVLPGVTLEPFAEESGASKFELTLAFWERDSRLGGATEWKTDLFDRTTIARLLQGCESLLEGAVADAGRLVSDLPLLAEAERFQLLREWNDTTIKATPALCLHELFERQAARTPEAVALACAGEEITYRELDERSSRLAHALRRLGVAPETRVALLLDRSPLAIVAMLGTLKSGGAYLPIDRGAPHERVAAILADAAAPVLLTQESLSGRFAQAGVRVLRLDSDWDWIAACPPHRSATTPVASAAYVIYTSGSTGAPKGVVVEHRQIVGYLKGLEARLGLPWGTSFAAVQPLSVDSSKTAVYPPLLGGGTLHLISEEMALDPQALASYFAAHRVEALKIAPSHLAALLGSARPEPLLPRSWLILGGEASRLEWVRGLAAPGGDLRVFNHYGPTETTVGMLTCRVEPALAAGPSLTTPLGRPLPGARAHVLDRELQPVPKGVAGELYIGGDCVARGYLGRPALTAERFVPDPFADAAGLRLYRTGDLVRTFADGNVEFLGRIDQQVKIRGFRIELGEVEAVLCRHPGVREGLVVAREDLAGSLRLVGYVVPRSEVPPAVEELQQSLREVLPEHMVPTAFVFLEALPRNAHGKADRKALPAPGWLPAGGYVAPRTPAEELLVGIFAQLLHAERVGAGDDFFVLGGHSLLATQLVSRVRECFGVELPVRAVFEAPSVSALAAAIERARSAGRESLRPAIRRAPRTAPLPLSFSQQRLWFLHQMEPASTAYNNPVAVRLRGPLDLAVLRACLSEIVRRHEALRTTFDTVGNETVQVIAPAAPLPLPQVDLRGLGPVERSAEARRLVRELARRPFDLARGPLFAAAAFALDEEEHAVLLLVHHIVSDAWSEGVLLRDLQALYGAFSQGRPSPLPELPVQYADYAVWQRQWLSGEALDAELAYWRERLGQAPPVLELPTDHPRPTVQTFRGASLRFDLPAGLSASLRDLSRRQGTTLFMTLLSAFAALLSRYSGQEDFVLGTPVAGRNHLETEGLIGFFINSLVLRLDLQGEPELTELVRRVREVTLSAYAHQDLPFEKLVEELHPQRDLARAPLFQVVFMLLNTPLEPLRVPGLALEPFEIASGTAKFDLTLTMAEGESGLRASLEYNRDLFDGSTMIRMAEHLRVLLGGMAAEPRTRISRLPLLTQAERSQIFREWNDTARPCPQLPMVHELFAAHAARRPEATAVASPTARLSYGEVDARANRLAHHLRSLGVGPEVLVALCTERTPERVVGIVAVLKAGGAYVSLDPTYPKERLAFLLADAQAPVLLTQERFADLLPQSPGVEVICLDADWEAVVGDGSRPPESGVTPDNLAYVVYTSGSTGKPKGVEIPHAGLMNLVRWHQDLYEVSPEDRGTQIASPAFDASIWELWPYLAGGAAVHIPDEETRLSYSGMIRWWGEQGITLAYLMTPLAEGVLEEKIPADLDLRVRALIIGGDRLHRGPDPGVCFRLMNHYGPAEYTVTSTVVEVPPAGSGKGLPTIGRPVDNTRIYVLDRRFEPVPVGVAGELYVAGVGTARGYHARPELTAEKFVPDPWVSEPGARMYRTADLVRYLPDGDIDFLGRLDHQVKIRGLRIELGEIESVLGQHPAVREAAVLVREERGGKRLAAYVVAAGEAPSLEKLREFLKYRLPEYMVPGAFVFLPALPLTPNGKVDRRALPAPEWSSESAYVAPGTPTEERLAAIWAAVLEIERVGVEDNFFDLGGHSLRMVQVKRRLETELGVEASLVELFQYPTVRSLADHLAARRAIRDGEPTAPPLVTRAGRRTRGLDGAAGGIAIIGMAGRFPGAEGVSELWENLRAGVESITHFTDEELIAAGVDPARLAHPAYVRAAGALDGADLFDAELFGINPREAEVMDPQHRIFLECAWHALEDAGYGSEEGRGAVGVFAGTTFSTYVLYADQEALATVGSLQALIGNDKDHLATRVSYKLGLKGPSVGVQTACSTSLVATHLACQSLRNGECDLALAGGVSIAVPLKRGYLYQEGSIASPDGHCRAFDAAAGGTVGGNGAGVVVLKRLEEALADGDPVYAVIKGSAINNDGADKVGYTAPSLEGQAAVIAEAQEMAGVAPETIGYVEAHGTGTRLGDPIEIAALTRAFRRGTAKTGFCAVGSIKTNIGHLDAGAGVAGLIKAALAVEEGFLPPSLNFEQPNPEIDFAASPFYVNAEPRRWPGQEGPRRAGVSSFGIGGTNSHVVLEEAPPPLPAGAARDWQLLVLSARTGSALDRLAASLAAHLRRHPDLPLADVAHTLQTGRKRLSHRRVLTARTSEEAAAVLAGGQGLDRAEEATRRPVVFLFPGQGSQYAGMGRELYEREELFRREVDRCAEILAPHLGLDLRSILFPDGGDAGEAAERLRQTALTQPALFVIEYALARLWMSWGMRPQAMLGHSIGEYVAACLAGVFSLADALALVAARGQLIQELPGGAMLSVPLPEAELAGWLGEDLSLAAVNAPDLCVVAGPEEAIEQLAERLAGAGHQGRRLHTSHAFHSRLMEPAFERFTALVAAVERRAPAIPWVSNLTGTWIEPGEAADPSYWARQMRATVRFSAGLERLLEDPAALLLEVGPGNTLTQLARRQSEGRTLLSSLRAPRETGSDVELLLRTLGRLWLAGAAVDWQGFHAPARRRRLHLPAYPFERRRYWIEGSAVAGAARPRETPREKEMRKPMAEWTYAPVWKQARPVRRSPRREERRDWLLFLDGTGLGEQLAERLRLRGDRVVTVSPGPSLTPGGEDGCQMSPGSPEQYEQLFDRLDRQGLTPHTIVHLWSVSAPGERRSLEHSQEVGFYSLLYLARALAKRGGDGEGTRLDLAVVSNRLHDIAAGEPLEPEKATVLGPVKVIPQELPWVRCRSIDCGALEVEPLLAELEAASGEDLVALRGRQRFVRTFERVSLEAPAGLPALLREGGTYWITGGLGGVGLVIARYLAEKVRARLVLTGRSALPEREEHIRAVRELESLGAEVLVLAADVADRVEMERAAGEAERRFGKIHGVVHSAGVPGGGLIQLKTTEAAARVMAPKLQGALALTGIFRDAGLDFLVLFSSLNGLFGGIGQVDYCAANAFLDALAQSGAAGPGTAMITVDWDGWQEVGMAAAHRRSLGLGPEALSHGILPDEGAEIFGRILEDSLPQIAVATRDLPALLERMRQGGQEKTLRQSLEARRSTGGHPRPALDTPYTPARDDVEEELVGIWQDLLGIQPVGIHANFYELGGHSLLATQVASRVREASGVEVPLDEMLAHPTVAELALAIAHKQAGSMDEESLAKMFEEFQQLTDQELEKASAAAFPETVDQERMNLGD